MVFPQAFSFLVCSSHLHTLCYFVSYPFTAALTEITPHSIVLLSLQEKHVIHSALTLNYGAVK